MDSKIWFAIPLAIRLSDRVLEKDIHLDGDLQEEYEKLIRGYITLKRNKNLNAKISKTYTKGQNLWNVTFDILERFHLTPLITFEPDGTFCLSFEKGFAWSKKECG